MRRKHIQPCHKEKLPSKEEAIKRAEEIMEYEGGRPIERRPNTSAPSSPDGSKRKRDQTDDLATRLGPP